MHVGPSWQVGLHINPWKVISHLRVHSRYIPSATAHSPANNAQLVPYVLVLFLANQRSPTVTLKEKSCLGIEGTVRSYSYSLLCRHLVQDKKHLRWLLMSRHFKFWLDSPTTWLCSQICDCQKEWQAVGQKQWWWQVGHKRNIHHHLHLVVCIHFNIQRSDLLIHVASKHFLKLQNSSNCPSAILFQTTFSQPILLFLVCSPEQKVKTQWHFSKSPLRFWKPLPGSSPRPYSRFALLLYHAVHWINFHNSTRWELLVFPFYRWWNMKGTEGSHRQ